LRPAHADPRDRGPDAATDAQEHGIRPEIVSLPMARRGFVPPPQRWGVERSFAWLARFRRLARDYERLAETLAGAYRNRPALSGWTRRET